MTDSEPKNPSEDQVVTPSLLRAARGTYRNAIRRNLIAEGFEDVPKNGPFVLGAMVNFGYPLADVVRELGVTKQATSQLIDLLVLRGYLERSPDQADRRRVILKPTERGRAAAAASRKAVRKVDRELSRHHTQSDIATFRACLSTLIKIEGPGEEQDEVPRPSESPRTRLIRFAPIFAVKDLRRALKHYESLGFTVEAYADGEGYGFAWRDGVELHFAAGEEYDPGKDASEAYLFVQDADLLAAEWSKLGIGGKSRKVGTMEYKMREGSHTDPDNNVIRFGSQIAAVEKESGGMEDGGRAPTI